MLHRRNLHLLSLRWGHGGQHRRGAGGFFHHDFVGGLEGGEDLGEGGAEGVVLLELDPVLRRRLLQRQTNKSSATSDNIFRRRVETRMCKRSVTQTHGSLEVWLEAFRVRAPDEQRRRALPQHDGVGKEHRVAEDIRAPQVEQPGDLVHELGKKTQRGKSSERTARKRKTAARRRNISS